VEQTAACAASETGVKTLLCVKAILHYSASAKRRLERAPELPRDRATSAGGAKGGGGLVQRRGIGSLAANVGVWRWKAGAISSDEIAIGITILGSREKANGKQNIDEDLYFQSSV